MIDKVEPLQWISGIRTKEIFYLNGVTWEFSWFVLLLTFRVTDGILYGNNADNCYTTLEKERACVCGGVSCLLEYLKPEESITWVQDMWIFPFFDEVRWWWTARRVRRVVDNSRFEGLGDFSKELKDSNGLYGRSTSEKLRSDWWTPQRPDRLYWQKSRERQGCRWSSV